MGQEILCLTFGIVFLMKMESRLNGKCLKLLYVSVINCWLKDSDGASHIPNLKCYTVVNGEPFAARLVIVWKGIETGQHKNRISGSNIPCHLCYGPKPISSKAPPVMNGNDREKQACDSRSNISSFGIDMAAGKTLLIIQRRPRHYVGK